MEQGQSNTLIQTDNCDETSNRPPKKQSRINLNQALGLCSSIMHYFCTGILSGFPSIVLAQRNDNLDLVLTKNEASWMSTIGIISMPFASMLAGVILTKIPRKPLQILSTCLEITAWFVVYFCTSIHMLLSGICLAGVANGMTSPMMPSFLGEISHPIHRGAYLSTPIIGLTSGLLCIHAMGALFSWPTCALLTSLFLFISLCLILYLKETYAWYIRTNQHENARKAFCWYRGEREDVLHEFHKLITREQEKLHHNYDLKEICRLCCSKTLLMPLCIVIVAVETMQFSGSKAIMIHSISILTTVIPSMNQYISTIVVDFVRIMFSLFACVILKRFPIRKLYFLSGIGSALSHFSFAALQYYSSGDSTLFSLLKMLSILCYTIFSSIGIVPLTIVIAGEIFPLIVKSIGMGIAHWFYYMSFFVVVKIAPELIESVGIHGQFLLFGMCTILGTSIMYFILPETKNKTLNEIEDLVR